MAGRRSKTRVQGKSASTGRRDFLTNVVVASMVASITGKLVDKTIDAVWSPAAPPPRAPAVTRITIAAADAVAVGEAVAVAVGEAVPNAPLRV